MPDRELTEHEQYAAEILRDRRERTNRFRHLETMRCGICSAKGQKAGELLSLYIAPEGIPVLLLPAHFSPDNRREEPTGPNIPEGARVLEIPRTAPVKGSKIPANCLVFTEAPLGFVRIVECRRCLQTYLAVIEWDGQNATLELHPTEPGQFARVVDG